MWLVVLAQKLRRKRKAPRGGELLISVLQRDHLTAAPIRQGLEVKEFVVV